MAQTFVTDVKFGFYTPEEMRRDSVLALTEPRTFDEHNEPRPGGLMDPRLGPTERGAICPTCGETERHCDGHLGRIELPVPVYQPLLFGQLHKLLSMQCLACHTLRLDALAVRWFV
eukprot:CAMPEP_0119288390 /NCGR_PEP_ID=MMETSP1329-20130426/37188_1 /TAXON_ID=114041 /ORGANISM="Genus nov. species nov., Strain RCC1024" /LENGTH=115 /DNA_ID=CAMNT_0007289171 /DNA_START=14 /DNA_END=357 /DNA_ORIENTATION=-